MDTETGNVRYSYGSNSIVIARLLWLIAGVPVLITAFQAIGALTGIVWAQVPLVGAVASLFHSIEAFAQARVLFFQQQALISILFLLISASWILFGVTLWPRFSDLHGENSDRLRSACAGLSGLLYLILFVGVYISLVGEVSILSLAWFFSIPILVTGMIIGSWLLYPRLGPIHDLEEAASIVDYQKATFESKIGSSFDGDVRESLRKTHPQGDVIIDQVRQEVKEYHSTLESLEREINQERESAPVSADRASGLKLRAQKLDAEAKSRDLEKTVLNAVQQRIISEFEDYSIPSPYGSEYKLVNHRSTIYLPSHLASLFEGGSAGINIEEVGPTVREAIESGTISITPALELLEALEEEFSAIEAEVSDRESEFVEIHDETVERLEKLESELSEDWDPPLANKLERIYFASPGRRHESLSEIEDKNSILERLAEAKESLHDCLFEEAIETANRATQTVYDLQILLEDLWLASERIRSGVGEIDLPSAHEYDTAVVGPEVYTRLVPALSRSYNVELVFDEQKNRLRVMQDASPDAQTLTETVDKKEIIEDIEFILTELEEKSKPGSDQASNSMVGLNIEEDIPDPFVTDQGLDCLREFLEDRAEVASYSVAEDNKYIEIEAANGRNITQCISQLLTAFKPWANKRYQ